MCRAPAVRCRTRDTIIPYRARCCVPPPASVGWQTRRHARPLGAVRRVRRPPARPRQPGAGRRRWCGCSRPVGIGAPAVRTGDLADGHAGLAGPGDAAGGPRATARPSRPMHRLDDAADRIYRRGTPAWDGRWRPGLRRRVRATAPTRTRLRARASPSSGSPSSRDGRLGRARGRARATLRSTVETRRRHRCGPPSTETFDAGPRRRVGPGRARRGVRRVDCTAADRLVETELESHDDQDEATFAARVPPRARVAQVPLHATRACPTRCCPERWPGRGGRGSSSTTRRRG